MRREQQQVHARDDPAVDLALEPAVAVAERAFVARQRARRPDSRSNASTDSITLSISAPYAPMF